MRAICPTCDTAYTIPDDRIGAAGRKVRCAKCGESWRVMRPVEDLLGTGSDAPVPAPAPVSVSPTVSAPAEDFEVAAPSDPVEAPTTTPIDDERFAAVAQHFESSPPKDAAPTEVDDAPAPIRAPAVKINFKPRGARRLLRLPKMPMALTRAAPFFGPLVFVTALLVIAGLGVFRTTIVATAPGLAGFYAAIGLEVNLRGLTIGPIETLREIDNGQPVLVVEGTLSNSTQKMRDVPALRFALRDGDAQELYAWSIDPKASTISPGDSLRFRTRLVAPPDRATDLQVRFVERRNQQARLP